MSEHVYKPLTGKRILFGVGGGIAAFKAPEYVRELVKLGGDVKVILTENGERFVGPLTFSALSNNKCETRLFDEKNHSPIPHIELSRWADCLVVLPATANIIAKAAVGIADDFLSTVLLSFNGPRLFFPSMNPNMFSHPATQKNIKALRDMGYKVIEPQVGKVVCGEEGKGRLVDFDTFLFHVMKTLWPKGLKRKEILITAGPTREPVDPVRFISNRSSGKMGISLARASALRGGKVELILGPTKVEPPPFLSVKSVETASQMADEVLSLSPKMDIIIMAAAVADYTPINVFKNKIKKGDEEISLLLKKTTDILFEIGKNKRPGQIVVGFCAETENLIENCFKKLEKKGLDLIVANNVTEEGSGFDYDTNKVYLIDSEENVEELPLLSKDEVSERILDRIEKMMEV